LLLRDRYNYIRSDFAAAGAKGELRKKLTAIDKTICAEIDAEAEAPNFEN